MLLKAILLTLLILGAFWFLTQPKQAQFTSPLSQKVPSIYEDSELKFSFEYPLEYEVVSENEEQYSERTKTKYRKNFDYYVGYEPPKFLKGLVAKKKDTVLTEDQFASVPLYVWVFENSDNLTVEDWYDSFWYYPFFWGVFDSRKAQIKPASGSAVIDYSPGKPKMTLIQKGDKMFLFKIMEGGQDLLEGFKFL